MNDLLAAYAAGWFPMAEGPDRALGLFRARQRALIPLDQRFHVPRSLRRQLRPGRFELKLNSAFAAVVDGCADRPSTWISLELRAIYQELHRLGWAHSIEAWDAHGLAGGQLGLAIGRCWIGESMFHSRPHASNVVLVQLQSALRQGGFELFDVQLSNPHLERFGCFELSDAEYTGCLAKAVQQSARLQIGSSAVSSGAWMPR